MNKLLLIALLLFATPSFAYFSFMNDSIEELREGRKRNQFNPTLKSVNISMFSHHTSDPGCKPDELSGDKQAMCQFAIDNGYNQTHPGLGVEIGLNDHVHLFTGFARNSFDEVSYFGGVGFEKRYRSFAYGLELGGISNHLASVFAGPYVKIKSIKVNYLPASGDGPETFIAQYSIKY